MHRALAAWLTERPWHAGVASVICGVMAPQMPLPFLILAGAIPVFVVLSASERRGMMAAVIASVAAAAVILAADEAAVWTLVGMVVVIFGAIALALVWRRTGSTNLCFQIGVLAIGLALTVVYLVLPDPDAIWVEQLNRLMKLMAEEGLDTKGVGPAVQVWARAMWGALAAISLGAILGSLFLGRWWFALLRGPGEFGAEFRQLRLGLVLGIGVTLIFILAWWQDSELLDSLAWVGLAALVFQGLAAAHRGKAVGRLNRGWLAAIYVLLLMPLTMAVTVFVLAIWGFTDNWLRRRATGL